MAGKQQTHYEIDMCNGPILSKMLRFSIPLMCSSVLQLLFNAADIVVVGRWAGDNSLAAVGSNTALIGLLTNLFVGLAVGANTLAAKYYGARDRDALHRVVHTSILLSIISGLVLTVVGVFGARTILIWMQTPENVLDLATLYLRIYFLGMTATMVYNFGAALLRAEGDTQRPLYFLSLAGVVNIVLNLFFVIVCKLDVAGVAIATVISQCISAALVVRCLVKETGPLRLDFRQLKIYPIKLKQIMQVGIPAGIQGMLFSLANVTVQSSVNSFGEIIMAGSSAAISIEQFIYSNINAFYQANVAFTSQNYGAGDYRRIKKIAMISVVTGVVTTELLSVLAVSFGPQLLGIYSPSAEVVAAGMVRLRWIALFYGLDAIMDVIVGSLRGVGYNILPMLVTLMGACASRLIWLSTVFRLPAYHRIEMVYIVYPLSWVLTATTHLICYFFVSRKVDRELRAHEAELAARMEESPEEADS